MPPQEVKLFHLDWDSGVGEAVSRAYDRRVPEELTHLRACDAILKKTHPHLRAIKAERIIELGGTSSYLVHAIPDLYANLDPKVSCDT
jgi:hypothetical protein